MINCCTEKMKLVEILENFRLGVLILLFLFHHQVVVPPRGDNYCVVFAVCELTYILFYNSHFVN